MNNEEQKNFESEIDPIRSLLGGLKRVDAPGNFDFRVKALIAKGRPAESSTSWFPAAVRLAVPMGILLSVGGYFGYNSLYQAHNVALVPAVEMQSISPAVSSDFPPVSMPANQNAEERAEIEPADLDIKPIKPAPRRKEKRIVLSRPAYRQPGGGSRVLASRTPRQIFVKGSAKDILTSIGIEADSAWKVGSVKQNSVAERSGLKAGDVIEAVNDQTLTEKTTFGNKFNSKSVRVLRDGKSVQIALKP